MLLSVEKQFGFHLPSGSGEDLRKWWMPDTDRGCCFKDMHICQSKLEGLKRLILEIYTISFDKVPKFSDARKLCCNLPKIQTKRPNLSIFFKKNSNGIVNSEDPDQTAPLGAV